MIDKRLFTPVLIGGCLILLLNFALRASYGVFQIPVSDTFGWPRQEFSIAIAVQNLTWGLGQPLFGALAERFGDRRAIILGILAYAAGLVLTGIVATPATMNLAQAIVGFGIAGTGFGVILAVVGRASSDENRSMSLAIATAAGSAGQVVGPPIAEWLLGSMNWQSVFVLFAIAILAVLCVLPLLSAPDAPTAALQPHERMGHVVSRALKDPTFALIFVGFFSCGYPLGFITAHFPAFVTELCGPIQPGSLLHSLGVQTTSALGAIAISVIGLANIGGTLAAGWLGKRYSKKYLLASIYAARTVVAGWFILTPITPSSILIFS